MAKVQSTTKVRLTVAIILIMAVFLALFDFPQIVSKFNEKTGADISLFDVAPFKLGLDLQGGTHLVYEADVSNIEDLDKGSAVEGVRDVIERRVNAFGVAEPVVQINKAQGKWRIIVELAGIKDVNEAIRMIGETPLLEFKEANNEPARELTAEEKKEMNDYNAKAKEKAAIAISAARSGQNFSEVVANFTEDEIQKETNGDLGWVRERSIYKFLYDKAKEVNVGEVYPEPIEQPEGYYIVKVDDSREDGLEVKAHHLLICYAGATRCDQETTKEEALAKINELKGKANTDNFIELVRKNSTEPGANEYGGDLGWFGKGMMVPEFENAVFAMDKGVISDVIETEFGYHLIYKEDERPLVEYKLAEVFIDKMTEAEILPPSEEWKDTGLTGKQLESAAVQFNQNTTIPMVSLKFNSDGAKLFGEITDRNVGKQVAIFLDGQVISAPRVNTAIKDGEAVIEGDFTIPEAKELAQRLNAGALPVPIELVSQQTVGASLGNASLQKSLVAGAIGFILVILFMIGYYRLPGLVASVALIIYGILLLFAFKAISVTLTLAGIAGVILSVGMAVDANVLIFERLKEELKVGKPLGAAVDEAFKRAWSSIRDGNVSTLITCVILAWFGTSMIKGFAITLSIGVLLSMFSAIVITKQFLRISLGKNKKDRNLWWYGIKKAEGKSK